MEPAVVTRLIRAIFDDPDDGVRRAALRAIVRLPLDRDGWIEAGRAVSHLLQSGVLHLQRPHADRPAVPLTDAIEAAAFVPVRQIRTALQRIVQLDDVEARRTAAHALAAVADPAGLPGLIEMLDDPGPWVRYAAARDIYRLHAATAPFREVLRRHAESDPYGSARFWLSLTLASLDEAAPLEALFRAVAQGHTDLVELAKDPDATTPIVAVPASIVPLLRRTADDEGLDYGLRHIAEDLLARTRSDQVSEPAPSPAAPPQAPQDSPRIDRILVELSRHAAAGERGAVDAVDYQLTEALNALPREAFTRAAFKIETSQLFEHYRGLKNHYGPRMHVAWLASRMPSPALAGALVSYLDSPAASDRTDAMELIELAARYQPTTSAPYFGGGGGTPEVTVSPADPLDFRDFGLSDLGIPPGYVAGVDVLETDSSLPGALPDAAPPPVDDVRLAAASLGAAKPGDRFVASCAAYVPALERQVAEEMRKRSRHAEPQLDMKACRWKRGTEVQVLAAGAHLTIDPPVDRFVWEGGRVLLSFEVAIDETAPLGTTVLKFNFIVAGVRVAMLPLEIEITARPGAPFESRSVVTPARTGFASYASADKLRVLDRVTELRNSAGIDVFQDCLDLNPGDTWKTVLEREIREREIFFLFWSQHAKASKWVEWEWRQALKERGIEAIALRPLEPNDQAPPPDELASLHANDPLMIIRQYYDKRATDAPLSGG